MRIVVQRVVRSSVSVEGKLVNEAGRGLMVLVGLTRDDNDQDIITLARKLVNLRVFSGPPSDDYFHSKYISNNASSSPSSSQLSTPATTTTVNNNDNDDSSSPSSPTSPFPQSGPFYVSETVSGAKTWAKSVMDIGGDIMIVSQFTLAHVLKGNKPDFHLARKTEEARTMFDQFVAQVNNQYDAFMKEKMPSAFKQQQQGKGTNKKPQKPEQEQQQQQIDSEQNASPKFITELPKAHRGKVTVGAFGEHMDISVELDGPVTIILDSDLGEAENEKKKEKEKLLQQQQQQQAAVSSGGDESKNEEKK